MTTSQNVCESKCVYSIGHSNVSLEAFIDRLKYLSISYLVDVRSIPLSSYVPYFNKDTLEEALKKQGIIYVFLGDYLGGKLVEEYQLYMQTESFKIGLERLESIISKGRTVIMCSEKDVRTCHRRFICDSLIRKGYKLIYHQIEVDDMNHMQMTLSEG